MSRIKESFPYLAGILMAVLFGFSFLFIKIGLKSYSAMELLSYRFSLAAIVLTLLVLTKVIKINLKGKPIKILIVLSIFEPILYFGFETMGIKYTSASEAGLFIALIPVFVTILAVIFLKERPNGLQIFFILVSVSGVLFILFLSGQASFHGRFLGILLLLGAVLSAGSYNIICRKSSTIFSPIEITFVMMWIAAIFFNLLYLLERITTGNHGSFQKIFTLSGGLPLLYLGIMCSIGGYFLLNYMLSTLTAARASVFANLITIVAVLAGVLFNGETFYGYEVAGGILIIAGVWGTNYFAYQKDASI